MFRDLVYIEYFASALALELEVTSNTSKATFVPRFIIAVIGSAMLCFVIGVPFALAWLLLLGTLEAGLHWLAHRSGGRPAPLKIALAFAALTALIGIAWSAVPIVFWGTGRPALRFAAIAIVVAQLIDIQCNTFKLTYTSIILGFVPAALFLFLPMAAALSARSSTMEIPLLGFCLMGTLAYFIISVLRNKRDAEKLDASIRAAEAASGAKSAFVAMISHELRTPLNGVIGLAHALKSATSAPEREAHTDLIIRSGETLMALLNDILDLAKVEARKLTLEPLAFDPHALTRDIYDLWAPIAVEKGLELRCSYPSAQSVWLFGDAARIRQITSNLVSNAIKFTSTGSVEIRTTLLAKTGGAVEFVVEVMDTGIGVNAEEKKRIFRPFAQARDSISREFGGTGLGLAISRGLVEMMGGSLTVASEADEGSTFTLRLSLSLGSQPQAAAPSTPIELIEGSRILIVDDNIVNLRVAVALLTALGARTTTATGGAEALNLMQDSTFDLVLMDIHMPGMGGIETLRRIRAGEAGDHQIPIVACTADAMTNEVSRFIDLGFDAVQCKPIVPVQLASTLALVLSQARSSSSAPSDPPLAEPASDPSGRGAVTV